MTPHIAPTAATALTVAAGGAAGAALRYQLWRWWPDGGAGFPFTTFAINVVGCFLFGVCVGVMPNDEHGRGAVLRHFLTFGVLGGFTTFSFFAVQGVTLTSPKIGALYLVVTPILAISAAMLGRWCTACLSAGARNERHAR
ncbi:MAG: CrcB family protein [Rhodococcus sp. (in: high G+C Gram-positive bacteria)]|uniref:fluoride efflux transporter FluC n=1 Tax=Rhodococcus sp. TaxID=1831 RepID=UPI003BAED9D9